MIQGQNAFYSPKYYLVFDNFIYRYDGKCVDVVVGYAGSPRSLKDFDTIKDKMQRYISLKKGETK